ncbi:hypothetical protein [Solicola sp. PLA-1-18]|uniref:hypothetical protein n=1 Tax=Solicola sp. PLA-1-18 TaxID=3380532 RepID=UPI003B7B5B8C
MSQTDPMWVRATCPECDDSGPRMHDQSELPVDGREGFLEWRQELLTVHVRPVAVSRRVEDAWSAVETI